MSRIYVGETDRWPRSGQKFFYPFSEKIVILRNKKPNIKVSFDCFQGGTGHPPPKIAQEGGYVSTKYSRGGHSPLCPPFFNLLNFFPLFLNFKVVSLYFLIIFFPHLSFIISIPSFLFPSFFV